ncbi:MAG: hypothetical protein Q8L86_02190 [Vicinamibacterales bacterium]|nr:hypothetical protein [Vicinamibacterales bacterium]
MDEPSLPGTPTEFARLWLRVAFPKAWASLGAILVVLGVASLYVSTNHRDWSERLSDLGWQLALGVFLLVFVFRTFVAPYEIYRSLKIDRDRLHAVVDTKRKNQAVAERLLALYQSGTHDVANMTVDPHYAEDRLKFGKHAHDWLTSLRSEMLACECLPQELSAVTDFSAADIPDPASLGYLYPGNPVIALEKAQFAMRLRALKRVINSYSEYNVL